MQSPAAPPPQAASSVAADLEDPFASISMADHQQGPGGKGRGSKFAAGEDVMYTDGSGHVWGAEVRSDSMSRGFAMSHVVHFYCSWLVFFFPLLFLIVLSKLLCSKLLSLYNTLSLYFFISAGAQSALGRPIGAVLHHHCPQHVLREAGARYSYLFSGICGVLSFELVFGLFKGLFDLRASLFSELFCRHTLPD